MSRTVLQAKPFQQIYSRKKNAPYLYDVVLTHALTWPTLTCQWLPDKQESDSNFSYLFLLIYYPSSPNLPYTTHRLLFGTHTSGQAQDYLQFATLHLPKRDAESLSLDRMDYDSEKGGGSIFVRQSHCLTISQS